MSFFEVSPQQAAALTTAWATATGAPPTAADLLGNAAHDEALGMPSSASALRGLAAVRGQRG